MVLVKVLYSASVVDSFDRIHFCISRGLLGLMTLIADGNGIGDFWLVWRDISGSAS
jgi:hypothetical protein